MLQLSGFAQVDNLTANSRPLLLRLIDASMAERHINLEHDACLFRGGSLLGGFDRIVTFEAHRAEIERIARDKQLVVLPDHFGYLGGGDVIRVVPGRNAIRVLFRVTASANYFLLTERCNHYCLMCSQPPKDIDDRWLAAELQELIPLLPVSTPFLGLTGGEPTLLGDDFFRLLSATHIRLPDTAVHILSNGRAFQDFEFALRYARIGHKHVSLGIPLYSADPEVHDYVVQSKGAFDETVKGILNLAALGQKVEIRVVVHKQTCEGLLELSEFIFRNLTFVDHVTFMGLEITGFTRANMDKIWIDPIEYRQELRSAVQFLASAKMNVSVYNHQLCVIDPSIHRFAKKSISDWKNEYLEECGNCSRRDQCGGFFSSSKLARSEHIAAFR
ncbi:His-Xaa-Ser system radical SAM maturase HsxC [Mesorhizobium plurifarium]|uniref:His-Xaa-Ser system radical SAM maturase HsxC n=1 Tax=Mesorhizobium plurifarium TaxID=69974 RepID=A0A0K2VZS3_MESPL|nr:His-Xaa-Ser system radical SAM maturase HsxC [Mesorhizobium plurifarium]